MAADSNLLTQERKEGFRHFLNKLKLSKTLVILMENICVTLWKAPKFFDVSQMQFHNHKTTMDF